MNVCGCMITFTTYILYNIVITIHDSNYKSGLQISAKVKEIQMNQMSRAYFRWDSREVKTDEKAKH